MTYYEELGVESTASEDEIRQAFQRLAGPRRDENSRRVPAAELERLSDIAGVLLDAGSRERYDRSLAALAVAVTGEQPTPARGWDSRWNDLAVAAFAVVAILLMFLIPAPASQDPVRSPSVGPAGSDWEPLLTPAYESHVPPPGPTHSATQPTGRHAQPAARGSKWPRRTRRRAAAVPPQTPPGP